MGEMFSKLGQTGLKKMCVKTGPGSQYWQGTGEHWNGCGGGLVMLILFLEPSLALFIKDFSPLTLLLN